MLKAREYYKKLIILVSFETIPPYFSSIFSFACGFYVLKISQTGSVFATNLAILVIITTILASLEIKLTVSVLLLYLLF